MQVDTHSMPYEGATIRLDTAQRTRAEIAAALLANGHEASALNVWRVALTLGRPWWARLLWRWWR